MYVKVAVILSVLFISGCAAIRNNVVVTEPTDGARARVRVAIPAGGLGRNVLVYPNSTCVGNNVPGKGRVLSNFTLSFEKTLNDKKIGMAKTGISENGEFIKSEIYVQAGAPMTLTTFRVQQESIDIVGKMTYRTFYHDGCGKAITFTPDENADYEVVFGEDKISCAASVNKIVEDQGVSSLTPVQFSQPINCPRK
jgi:hypothetical protein